MLRLGHIPVFHHLGFTCRTGGTCCLLMHRSGMDTLAGEGGGVRGLPGLAPGCSRLSPVVELSRKQRIAFYCPLNSDFSFFSLVMSNFLHSCQGGENLSHFSAGGEAVPSVQLCTGL